MLAFLKRVIAGRYRIMLKARNKAWLLFRCVNLIQWWYRLVVQAIILGQIHRFCKAPRAGHEPVVFDMATTVQAWGKF